MFKNYFKTAYRSLLKNKAFSLLNIFGLAIGMAACFFIFQYVHFETSYDRFHKNAKDLYRVPISYSGSFKGKTASNHPATGPALKAEFPEVVDFARIVRPDLFMNASTVTYKDAQGTVNSFNEDKMYIADQGFLTMFSFPFTEGDPKKALTTTNAVVISKSTALKYFGKENPMGKTIYLNKNFPLKVTGVFADVPENSHIRFNLLISFVTLGEKWGYDEWTWPEFYNYIQLRPGSDPSKLEAKFPALINKYIGAKMKELNFGCAFHLQPVTDIHLKSDYENEAGINGSDKEIYVLSIIGIFVLLIGWINYINLSTAKSMERAKEVGMRKVVGAGRLQLMFQFIIESFILNFIALCIAALLVLCLFPFFGSFIGKDLRHGLGSGLWQAPWFWAASLAIFIAGSFIVGSYPAFVLSAFRPVLVLKGKFSQSGKGILLRRALVSFQFILSILLIAGTITVYRQLSFMRNQKLGYNKEQLLVVKAPAVYDSTFDQKMKYFTTELRKNPAVLNVGSSSEIPGKSILSRTGAYKSGEDKSHASGCYIMEMDENFLTTFQSGIAAGRDFKAQDTSSFFKKEKTRVLINEELARAMGYKDNESALNQDIYFQYGSIDHPGEIIGVVKNYHQRSLKEKYDPIMYVRPAYNYWKYFSLQMNTNNLGSSIASIEKLYKQTFLENPFEYFFLNDFFDQQYRSDQRFGRVFGLFTVLAIFISCLGLLGLSSFVVKLRTKEIGVRKVLGASVPSILMLFSKDFIKLVLIASAIAIPVVYFVAKRWLGNYAFRIELSWFIFLLPPILLLVVTLVTIGVQSLKAAVANPVKSLRAD